MKKNVGGIDKILRIILGIGLILIGLFASIGGGIRIIVFTLAGIALFTGIYGF
jgi:hypothetical protein